ncbi:MAG: alanine dehydrogenase [Chlamydiae bacterium]|nr:alanine dehydrogenase [Chlamydiota bacterium]
MDIGVPKEIKDHEYRVGVTPYGVKALVEAGHKVHVQKGAGEVVGFSDKMYEEYGAKIAPSEKEVYKCPMVIKVKEPQSKEFPLLQKGQVLFCYLHLAPDPEQTKHLLKQGVVGIAYETITDQNNRLPLLVPMSEMAGRLSVVMGNTFLQLKYGGRGVFLGGIPGVSPANVIVLGGGIVGTEAARMAMGLGANVTIFDKNLTRLRELDYLFGPLLKTRYANPVEMEEAIYEADLVVGAVLLPGGKAPVLIKKRMLKKMRKGSVIVDVAIDQGGCCETSRPTSHSDPIFIEDGVIHYCVTNMPSACARTATLGLTNATLPFALNIANMGYKLALMKDPHLLNGLNVCEGHVTNQNVAQDLGYAYVDPKTLLA